MKTHEIDKRVARCAERQAGAICLHQVTQAGGDSELARRRVRDGRWQRLARGIYRLCGVPLTWFTWLWAAHFEAGTDSVISHRSAARIHGLWAYRHTDAIDITRRECRDHDITLGRLHETSILDPDHVVEIDGLPVTSLARTIFDLAGDPPRHLRGTEQGWAIHGLKIRRVVNNAMRRHGLTVGALAAVLAALGKKGRPGTRLIRQLVKEFGPGYVPTESELEDIFLEVLRAYGLPVPTKQVRLGTDEAFVGRVDFLYEAARLIIEVDGRDHDGPLDRDADRWRDNDFNADGWHVIRVRWRDLTEDPGRVARAIRRALRSLVDA
ncbi:MAG: DUF559 domain-containing protein [Acidimicrobiales bacterium]